MQCRQKYNWRKMALENNFEPLFFHSWYRLCCCCSVIKSCLTLWTLWAAAGQALHPSLSPRVCSNSCPLSRWCCLITSSSATPFSFAFSLSQHEGLFQWVDPSHQVTKVLELQHSPTNEYSRLIFIKIDWFVLFAIQGALKSRLKHHNLKASILWHSAFCMVRLSHTYMTTPTVISVHDYWKNYSFDYTKLCWQCDISASY